jgi:hypothetical protein
VRHRRQEQRRVGDASGDDDVGAGLQRRQQCRRAEVGIRRDQLSVAGDRRSRFQSELAGLDLRQHVVAGDHRHPDRHLLRSCDVDDRVRRGDGVGRAHIRDEAHAVPPQQRQQQLDAPLEQRIVAARWISALSHLRQRHRALAQAFEHEIANAAALGERGSGLQAVAGEAGAGADA